MATLESVGLTPAFADLAYGTASEAQKIDIYLPSEGEEPFPVVLFLHGGGFRFGDKAMSIPAIVKGLVDSGIAVATANYRLSEEATFPAAPQDVGRAIEFLRAHADDYGLDPDRLVAMGESAGANLAALAGTASEDPVLRGGLEDAEADIRPAGVVALYPPVDFLQLDALLEQQGCEEANHAAADSFESLYLGGAIESEAEAAQAANPITHIDEDTPPFFVENGSADCQVGTAQSQLLVSALETQGIPVAYTLLDGAGHGGEQFETPENVELIVTWVEQLFAGETGQP